MGVVNSDEFPIVPWRKTNFDWFQAMFQANMLRRDKPALPGMLGVRVSGRTRVNQNMIAGLS